MTCWGGAGADYSHRKYEQAGKDGRVRAASPSERSKAETWRARGDAGRAAQHVHHSALAAPSTPDPHEQLHGGQDCRKSSPRGAALQAFLTQTLKEPDLHDSCKHQLCS